MKTTNILLISGGVLALVILAAYLLKKKSTTTVVPPPVKGGALSAANGMIAIKSPNDITMGSMSAGGAQTGTAVAAITTLQNTPTAPTITSNEMMGLQGAQLGNKIANVAPLSVTIPISPRGGITGGIAR